MTDDNFFDGIWLSRYEYPSSTREGRFESKNYVKFHRKGHNLVAESVPGANESYLVARFSVDNNVATGTWQEQMSPDGYYQGAIYHGAAQLIIDRDAKRISGKWVGFGKDMQVNDGSWEFVYVGETLPHADA